ncbi:hypothetical protein [Bacillus sp. AK031]
MHDSRKDELDSKLKSMPVVKIDDAYKKEMHQNLMEQVVIHENMSMKQRLKNRILVSIGSLLVVGFLLLLVYISMGGEINGFSMGKGENVVMHYDSVENYAAFQEFLEDIEERRNSTISVTSYGIEGQEWVRSLDYNGYNIAVKLMVDGEFIESHFCTSILTKEMKDTLEYTLNQCGKTKTEYPFLIVPKSIYDSKELHTSNYF